MESDNDDIPTGDCCDGDDCESSNIELFFCAACVCTVCAGCWDKQIAHKKNRLGPGGIPHEKTQLGVARQLEAVFSNQQNEAAFQKLHQEDEGTIWFGEF
jgi:hypothetical protein